MKGWGDLGKDVLLLIFANLSAPDLIGGVSLTCSSWRDASKDQSLWRHLDFGDWEGSAVASTVAARRRDPSEVFSAVLDVAVCRGNVSIEKIWFPGFADETNLLYVAQRCPKLCYFSLENEMTSVDGFCEAVGMMKSLRGMSIPDNLVCDILLQQVTRCCVHFSELKIISDSMDLKLAKVVCKSIPHLVKLELSGCYISQRPLLHFLDELKDLEHLDISEVRIRSITGVVLEKASRLKAFIWESELDQDISDNFQHSFPDIMHLIF